MQDKITIAIKKAKDLISEIEFATEAQRNILFEKAIDFYLGQKEETPKNLNNPKLINFDSSQQSIDDENDFWGLLSQKSNLGIEILKDIYVTNKNQILPIIPTIKGKNNAEQCSYLAAIVCFAYHEGKKIEWVPTKYLVEAAKHLNLNTSNLNRDLNKTGWFRKRGKKKGVEYKLSAQGISEVKKYLNEFKNRDYESAA